MRMWLVAEVARRVDTKDGSTRMPFREVRLGDWLDQRWHSFPEQPLLHHEGTLPSGHPLEGGCR